MKTVLFLIVKLRCYRLTHISLAFSLSLCLVFMLLKRWETSLLLGLQTHQIHLSNQQYHQINSIAQVQILKCNTYPMKALENIIPHSAKKSSLKPVHFFMQWPSIILWSRVLFAVFCKVNKWLLNIGIISAQRLGGMCSPPGVRQRF